MVMGNAALPFRDIVRSFDRFTVSVLNALIQWNRLFNEEIEYTGDLRPVAKGATSLIAKEVRAYALDNLKQTLDEEEMVYVDSEKLLRQRMMARDIPFDDIAASEEEVRRRQEQRASKQTEMEQQAKDMFSAELKEVLTDAMKNAAQAKKHLDNADVSSIDAMVKLLQANNERGVQGE